LARLCEARPDTTVITLLAETSLRSQVHVILSEAVAAVARDALPETLRKVFERPSPVRAGCPWRSSAR
jgi:hypothetical protein